MDNQEQEWSDADWWGQRVQLAVGSSAPEPFASRGDSVGAPIPDYTLCVLYIVDGSKCVQGLQNGALGKPLERWAPSPSSPGEKTLMTDTALTIPARKIDIVQDIQNRVLTGEWGPGSQLPSERELSSEYGVSRPVIREALAGLVELGFIEIHPGRGSFVRAVKIDDLSGSLTRAATMAKITARDLVIARLGLECSAAELAAKQPDRPLEGLRHALREHAEATTLQSMADTDLAFHETVVAASGNPVLMLMFGAIRNQVHALMLRSHSDPSVQRQGEPFHEKIVQAIADGNSVNAREFMREHLELALELYGTDLDRPISEVVESRGLRFASVLSRPNGPPTA